MLTLYTTQLRLIMEYADCFWINLVQYQKDRLEELQLEAMQIITEAPRDTHHATLYTDVGLESLDKRRKHHQLVLYYKMVNNPAPTYLSLQVHIPQHQPHEHNTRSNDNPPVWTTHTAPYKNSFLPSVIKASRELPTNIRQCLTLSIFKGKLKAHIASIPKHLPHGKEI